MEPLERMKPGDVLSQAELATYIGAMGIGIAEAQRAMDKNTLDQLGAFVEPQAGLGGKTLLEIGLMPAFYFFRSATLSCSVSMSLQVHQNLGADGHLGDGAATPPPPSLAKLVADKDKIKTAVDAIGAQAGYAALTGAPAALTAAQGAVMTLAGHITTAQAAATITQAMLDGLETDRAAIDTATAAMAAVNDYATLATGAATYDAAKAATATFKVSLGLVKIAPTKSATAMGNSLDARYARSFDLSMAGNMSIAAELVSIPAPPEFLHFIRDYLK
jgi:hypothetical protein